MMRAGRAHDGRKCAKWARFVKDKQDTVSTAPRCFRA